MLRKISGWNKTRNHNPCLVYSKKTEKKISQLLEQWLVHEVLYPFFFELPRTKENPVFINTDKIR